MIHKFGEREKVRVSKILVFFMKYNAVKGTFIEPMPKCAPEKLRHATDLA